MKWTPALLASIPDDVLLSEAQRRRARKRKTYSGGIYWRKHNPDVNNCRCIACSNARDAENLAEAASQFFKGANPND